MHGTQNLERVEYISYEELMGLIKAIDQELKKTNETLVKLIHDNNPQAVADVINKLIDFAIQIYQKVGIRPPLNVEYMRMLAPQEIAELVQKHCIKPSSIAYHINSKVLKIARRLDEATNFNGVVDVVLKLTDLAAEAQCILRGYLRGAVIFNGREGAPICV